MLQHSVKKFRNDTEGTVLVETLLAAPILVLLTLGILEFGNMMWQRQQLQVGVRDAARYWSRCNSFSGCSSEKARKIALYGDPNADETASPSPIPRVPGWTSAVDFAVTPEVPVSSPTYTDTVSAFGRVQYRNSPFFQLLIKEGSIKFEYSHEQRYQGW